MRTTMFHTAMVLYTERLKTLPRGYPFWVSRLSWGLLPYTGLLYRPYRQHHWSDYYTYERNVGLTPEDRRLQRLAQLPSSDLWGREAFAAARMHWVDCCAICHKDLPLVRDHLVPISHQYCPGTVPSNLLPLCVDCNREKSNVDLCAYMVGRTTSGDRRIRTVLRMVWEWQEQCWERGWR